MAKSTRTLMRIIHRYLGFFLAGIMTVYALSGVVLIFRDSNFLKQETIITKQIKTNAKPNELKDLLGQRRLKIEKQEGDIIAFTDGTYNTKTGEAIYTQRELPYVLNKMTHLHKSKSGDPLFFLNIFFGLSLLFFVLSSFWMFLPKTTIFKKGMYYTVAGIVLTLILLFV
ncbi:PepSY domain-containing protein [Siansivirga zeaxanthinifaciens]|uniref:Membrane protein n=1 Tax=Siansivirga zeaxanthinifaciens CC-SAMT-1 TaxID=1454006 RepID=A0A0C5W9E9_9FLAO|nr:PepSY domain-containing protein [Siansivirga zeaxanthinifaciens]AJR02927.1 membrane protein [Siansivirga zeaxanthinifaciens CC-SAMT-1]